MGDKRIREVFNVEAVRRAYMAFIDRLRDQLRGNRLVGDRPVLPSSEEVRSDPWFEIVLQTNHPSEITLRFKRHNLHLEAYRNGSGTWLEFSTPDQVEHVIQGSEFLGFDGSYIGSHGLEAAAGRGRDRVRLGRDDLRDAVNNLATCSNREERARSLIVLIQMTAESIRFDEVLHFILVNYVEGRGNVPGSLLLKLENSWGLLSNSLLHYDAHDNYNISIFPIQYMDVNGERRWFTREQVTAALGMLLYAVKGIVQTRQRRSVDFALRGNPSAGRPLLEVFNAKINNIDNEFIGNLYGTISVDDGLMYQYIYNRARADAEYVWPKGEFFPGAPYATLSGPTERCISASDYILINVYFMDKDSFPDLSPDDHVGNGCITWSAHNRSNDYDVLLSKEISGDSGKATIFYAIFSDAVQARVEVKLINADNEKTTHIYGMLCVTNFENESVLFIRTDLNAIKLRPQQLIPLARSLFAVPLNSELKVKAELVDRDLFPDLSTDDIIAQGTVTFPAQLTGTSQKIVSGVYGSIEVKVTWTS